MDLHNFFMCILLLLMGFFLNANKLCMQAVFPLAGMVAIGWLLIIIGFGIETNQPLVHALIPADAPVRYSW